MQDNEILVSFIIPVYNAVKYLERCLSSVCGVKSENIEIIVVDDGSGDESCLIYNNFAKTDHRICIVEKKNGGVSSARNIGIQKARGKWITFIDSDDEIVPEVYDSVLSQVNDTARLWILGIARRYSEAEASAVVSRTQGIWSDNDVELIKRNLLHGDIKSVNDIQKQGFDFHGPCAKFFLAEIIKKNNLEFPENIIIGEDSIFVYRYLDYAKKIAYTNECGYYYWQNNDSAMHRLQKGGRILESVLYVKNMLGEDNLLDYGQFGVRRYLYALKMDWCNSQNPDSYFVRKKEAIKWRNMTFMHDAFHYFKLSQIRWEAMPIALCAKMKCFFLCNLFLKLKEKLPIRF